MFSTILAFYVAQITSGNITPEILKDYAVVQSLSENVDPQIILHIIAAESQFNPNAIGDHGTSIGEVQIHLPAHPDISPEEAENPIFATRFVVSEVKNGKCSEWSTCPLPSQ